MRLTWRQAHARGHAVGRAQIGFSLIEVLIALVVLAIGLLGLGLLQTMNLRYTQSANQRTMAVNLASELLDTMRTNRSLATAYAMGQTDFSASATPFDPATGCGAATSLSASANALRWRCEVKERLGTDAYATVDVSLPAVIVTVVWREDGLPGNQEGNVELRTRL
ncbi:MAG: type IV pilus modification protein PilV [Luteimonas sp.]